MGLNDVKVMAERERELIALKDNYEETMAKMRDKRIVVENNIIRLREEADATQIEINRLKAMMANNKRIMEENVTASSRVHGQIRDLCMSYQKLVSPQLNKRMIKQVDAEDLKNEIELIKVNKETKETKINRLRNLKQDKLQEINQAIKIEETKEEIYRKNLSDIDRQLLQLKSNE